MLEMIAEVQGVKVQFVNIYVPNEDDVSFFTRLGDLLNESEIEQKVVGGGFNLVMDREKDKKGGAETDFHGKS